MKAKKVSVILMTAAILAGTLSMAGCGTGGGSGSSGEEVVIYSNADDEAVEAMKKTLDENGYEGKYLFQTFPKTGHTFIPICHNTLLPC